MIVKNRFGNTPRQTLEEKLPARLSAESLNAEEALFLMLHAQKPLLAKIAEGDQDAGWIEAIAAGFASLLQHSDMTDHATIYQGGSEWHAVVQPPSVVASMLLMFLDRLSNANAPVHDGVGKRGSVQGFLRLLEGQLVYDDTTADNDQGWQN